MRRTAALVALVVALAACSDDGAPTSADEPSPSGAPEPSVTEPSPPAADAIELAEPPGGDIGLWLDTIGVPVVAAVRTSTPLARLADTAPDGRAATCRQVAAELDTIAPPPVLAGLAITADAETAALLVGDLQAKGDLLAACVDGGDELDALIAEVEVTHRVAVAWLRVLGDA